MPIQVAPKVYQLQITLPNSPLKSLNSYLIMGHGGNLLIDTGFRLPECRQSLLEELSVLNVSLTDTDIYLTHLHADHAGLAPDLVKPNRKIYISQTDGELIKFLDDPHNWVKCEAELVKEGFPQALVDDNINKHPGRIFRGKPFDHYTFVNEGDFIEVGDDINLKVVATPGHTPGHTCLYWKNRQLLFLGDHILYSISPNITHWYQHSFSLQEYMVSLEKIKQFPALLALAAHRDPCGDWIARADELLTHHENRLKELLSLVRNKPGITCFDAAGQMRWKIQCESWEKFPVTQKWFAVGEVVAHMNELIRRGLVTCQCKNGLNGYWIL